MGLNDFILNCERDNKELRKDIEYYKNKNQRLQQENQELKKQLEQEKEELMNYLKEQIKHIDDLITKGNPKPYGEELNLHENSKLRYLEILSKIEKSDK